MTKAIKILTDAKAENANDFSIITFLDILNKINIHTETLILAMHSYKFYKYSKLQYHNFNHILTVLKSIGEMTNDFKASDINYNSLLLAACYHDAIYIPGNDSNEMLSSQAYFIECNKLSSVLGYKASYPTDIMELIMATTIGSHLADNTLQSHETKLLLDADMSSLALEREAFLNNNSCILRERLLPGKVLTTNDLNNSALFLKQFLDKETIFNTENGKKLYESKARDNIKMLIDLTSTMMEK